MPNAYPAEFRADVFWVARKRETTLAQIAKDFGISDATLANWATWSRSLNYPTAGSEAVQASRLG